jgi:hypothetical protein
VNNSGTLFRTLDRLIGLTSLAGDTPDSEVINRILELTANDPDGPATTEDALALVRFARDLGGMPTNSPFIVVPR